VLILGVVKVCTFLILISHFLSLIEQENMGLRFFTHSRQILQSSVSISGRGLQRKTPSEAGEHMNLNRLT